MHPASEAGVFANAEAALDYLITECRIRPSSIVLYVWIVLRLRHQLGSDPLNLTLWCVLQLWAIVGMRPMCPSGMEGGHDAAAAVPGHRLADPIPIDLPCGS